MALIMRTHATRLSDDMRHGYLWHCGSANSCERFTNVNQSFLSILFPSFVVSTVYMSVDQQKPPVIQILTDHTELTKGAVG